MKETPLVSVICLCHNHKHFVIEAIESVLQQTHPRTELIVVDDGSSDNSKQLIEQKIKEQDIVFVDNPHSIGNCAAFNKGLRKAKGDYIIDLSADDVLLPNRIERGLLTFKRKKDIGVEFCNVLNITIDGIEMSRHFKENTVIPEGDLYTQLIQSYIISAPGMMIKRAVLEKLEGYDEELSYEDFDFWIRSSRNYEYGYTDQILVKKRKVAGSLSSKQLQFRSIHQKSTLAVCRKIKSLNQSQEEDRALRKRCMYEIKMCLKSGNIQLIPNYLKLMI